MTEDQRGLLLEASDSINAARLLLQNMYPGYAAARAYFAMFYVAEAFLEGEGLHSANTPPSSQPSGSTSQRAAGYR